jgi:O-6-methylguanine DNA methyltransferase
MKNNLQSYLCKLSGSGAGFDFSSAICRYGKFTIYCLIGPEENILQVCFTPGKHAWLQEQLKCLDRRVYIRRMRQKEFHADALFAEYFSGRPAGFPFSIDAPLIAAGTDFQKRVWSQIAAIPYARCITYKQLAELAGSPAGARAAARACGANPLAIIVPCHRVVAVNGPGGFAGGVAMKKALLALEDAGAAS